MLIVWLNYIGIKSIEQTKWDNNKKRGNEHEKGLILTIIKDINHNIR